ncbi:hypothetical protein D3C84_477350 [compost metagenome]
MTDEGCLVEQCVSIVMQIGEKAVVASIVFHIDKQVRRTPKRLFQLPAFEETRILTRIYRDDVDVLERRCASTGGPIQRFVTTEMVVAAPLNVDSECIDERVQEGAKWMV